MTREMAIKHIEQALADYLDSKEKFAGNSMYQNVYYMSSGRLEGIVSAYFRMELISPDDYFYYTTLAR